MKVIKKIFTNKKFLIFLFLVIILIIYLYNENTSLATSKYNITSNVTNSFKIAQVSDYHNSTSNRLNKKLIKELKKEKPNIIVVTGDLIDSFTPNEEVALSFIDKLLNISPVFYVNGNHEARYSGYSKFESSLVDVGVKVLNDTNDNTYYNEYNINIIGIRDDSFTNVNSTKIKNLRISNAYNILLSHRPECFLEYVEAKVDLVFSGHAHGGQIRIPFVGGVIAPNQGMFPNYDSGLYEDGNTKMIVSRGIGNSIFPFRINNNPELVIVDIGSVD